MEYRSVSGLNEAILRGLDRVPSDIDLVVGVPRSGILAASLVALHFNLPLIDLEGFIAGRAPTGGDRLRRRLRNTGCRPGGQKRCLILDDSYASGASMERVKASCASARRAAEYDLLFGAVFVVPERVHELDLWFEAVSVPRIFEWNLFHHQILSHSCLDMDGVLCRDPTPKENDDGPEYRRFLSTATPKHLPSVTLGHIVTSRLEKYRPETEDWLRRHCVSYAELKMMMLDSAEERRARGCHARFKAREMQKADGRLFIESDLVQAREIQRITGKPVFCTDARTFLSGPADVALSRLNRAISDTDSDQHMNGMLALRLLGLALKSPSTIRDRRFLRTLLHSVGGKRHKERVRRLIRWEQWKHRTR